MHLYIAYKNYSSWGLRPWIAMKVAGIPFQETIMPFAHSNTLAELGKRYEIPALAPVLDDDGLIIWDSLAILEYLNEQYPDRQLWPSTKNLRALARSAAAQMHSSFAAMRTSCPMNCRTHKQITPSVAVQEDLQRLAQVWAHFAVAEKPPGEFLCGHFTIVDAMFAPMMWRVLGYGLEVSPAFARWSATMLALPAMQEWLAAAQQEAWTIPKYEMV